MGDRYLNATHTIEAQAIENPADWSDQRATLPVATNTLPATFDTDCDPCEIERNSPNGLTPSTIMQYIGLNRSQVSSIAR